MLDFTKKVVDSPQRFQDIENYFYCHSPNFHNTLATGTEILFPLTHLSLPLKFCSPNTLATATELLFLLPQLPLSLNFSSHHHTCPCHWNTVPTNTLATTTEPIFLVTSLPLLLPLSSCSSALPRMCMHQSSSVSHDKIMINETNNSIIWFLSSWHQFYHCCCVLITQYKYI